MYTLSQIPQEEWSKEDWATKKESWRAKQQEATWSKKASTKSSKKDWSKTKKEQWATWQFFVLFGLSVIGLFGMFLLIWRFLSPFGQL